MRLTRSIVVLPLFLVLASNVFAVATLYVNGLTGSDGNNCLSSTFPCKTIGHAISLASSGDAIRIAAATYSENLTIGINLTLAGSSAPTTFIDGGGKGTVVVISSATAHVTLSKLTIQNGSARYGGGISNAGILRIISSIVTKNKTAPPRKCIFGCNASGGGIQNGGTLTINNTTVSGNTTSTSGGRTGVSGGGIANGGILKISNSTISGNSARETNLDCYTAAYGGGISNNGTAYIYNSTITANSVFSCAPTSGGAGIWNQGNITISNVTVSPDNLDSRFGQSAVIQNSILGGCIGALTSKGYNLSSDDTCGFSGPGDMNKTDPMLGPLQNNGGPTQTMALPSGSPAIDAGNYNGCTDSSGNLLKTDQRGMPRHDPEDRGGCDIGAFEKQSD